MATPPRKGPKTTTRPAGTASRAKSAPRAGAKPFRSEDKPAPRAGAKPFRSDAKPFRSDAKPFRSDAKPFRSDDKPTRSGDKPTRSSDKPTRSGDKPAPHAGAKPFRSEAKPFRSDDKPAPRAGRTFRPDDKPAAPRAPGARPAPRAGAKPPLKPRAKAAPRTGPKVVQHGDRLQKILAAAGVDSRRACEEIILAGRVQVNGVTITELGSRADPRRDEITVDFVPITKENLVYILLNKPKGYVTSVKDDQGRPTVMALIHGVEARVYPVGRLDFNSEGLLLMTNDGALAQRLMNPEFHVAKVYLVKVHRMPKPETLDEFREGFRLDGRRLKPCGIEIAEKADNPWLRVTLIEGKNQQIRRMFGAVGHPVSKLRRIQFGPLEDPAIKPGEWRFLNPQELAALKAL